MTPDAGQELDGVVPEPDLRLIQERPEVSDHRRDSIIGIRITVVQKAWPRKRRSIR